MNTIVLTLAHQETGNVWWLISKEHVLRYCLRERSRTLVAGGEKQGRETRSSSSCIITSRSKQLSIVSKQSTTGLQVTQGAFVFSQWTQFGFIESEQTRATQFDSWIMGLLETKRALGSAQTASFLWITSKTRRFLTNARIHRHTCTYIISRAWVGDDGRRLERRLPSVKKVYILHIQLQSITHVYAPPPVPRLRYKAHSKLGWGASVWAPFHHSRVVSLFSLDDAWQCYVETLSYYSNIQNAANLQLKLNRIAYYLLKIRGWTQLMHLPPLD